MFGARARCCFNTIFNGNNPYSLLSSFSTILFSAGESAGASLSCSPFSFPRIIFGADDIAPGVKQIKVQSIAKRNIKTKDITTSHTIKTKKSKTTNIKQQ